MRQVTIKRSGPAPLQKVESIEGVMQSIWSARGLTEAPNYELSGLLAPTLLGLPCATERLATAIAQGQRILVVGDFDADGATATALAVDALQAFGAKSVQWLIPDRFRHGYGLSPRLVEELATPLPELILTVDQGISSHEGIALAQARGIQVIVTDHHLPGETLPEAEAIVNPNLSGDPFPSKHLAGVGVLFYLMVALRQKLREGDTLSGSKEPRLDQWLDLVALGTVADLVKLDENNRRLVAQGMDRIRRGNTRPGIRALLEVAGRNLVYINASDLGFAVAPRLNAAGRLEEMSLGVRCLLAKTDSEAMALAKQLDAINQQRKTLQADMQEQAHAQADHWVAQMGQKPAGVCLFDASWHQGIVGLVAGQVAERLSCPVVAFAPDEEHSDTLKGSARSPFGIHMRDLLVDIDQSAPGVIDRFGGHAKAAGLTISQSKLDDFRGAFDKIVSSRPRHDEVIHSDGSVPEQFLNSSLAKAIDLSGPWGQGFEEPIFDDVFEVIERRIVGGEHLKLRLRLVNGQQAFDAIAFRAAGWLARDLPSPWHLTYKVEVNRWRGQERLQLNIQHWVERVLASA